MFSFLKNLFRKKTLEPSDESTKDDKICYDAILDSDRYILQTYMESMKEIPLSSLGRYPNDSKRKILNNPVRLMYKQEAYGVVISELQYKVLQDLVFRMSTKKKCSLLDKISAIAKEDCTIFSDMTK